MSHASHGAHVLRVCVAAPKVVFLAEPSFGDDLHRYFGVHDGNAWLYVLAGASAVLAATVSPTFFRREQTVARRDVVEGY